MNISEINDIVKNAISELNTMRTIPIEESDSVILLGSLSQLDSLDFVTLLTTIEDLFRSNHNINLVLMNDRTFSLNQSPYRTLGDLKNYLLEQANAANT